ncbi:fimbria/pilus periplasmic chaperone [Erythrobacter arachoides]|uniref:Fimbria/pilus periplasmic chaperone n=1 Tax=Aurantiacibacter arachoides TaxID=1850444 RepID=A0A845A160_9SPHN|nr:fimbria/pilus periplasmic chaperone [Aurantiacibacter arachoides]MXO93865.1 fimbria/pilus periplasmic chaperone [Aurantiacibacter arachoides]
MSNLFRTFATFACTAALIVPVQQAEAYDLTPIVVQLKPNGAGSSQTMVITNSHGVPIAIEIQAFQRTQMPTGEDQLEPEDEDLIVYPPQMVIPPNSSQSFRVQWVGDPAPERELAYRIVTQQLPIRFEERIDADRAADLTVRYRYEAALYILPDGAEPSARLVSVERVRDEAGVESLELAIVSEGTMRAILHEPVIELTAAGGSALELTGDAITPLEGLNILPGVERRVRIAAPAQLPPGPLSGALTTRYVVLQ